MKLVTAKCPNCGANIDVLPELEAVKCKSCGSAILVDDSIQKHQIFINGKLTLAGISTVENDLEIGKQCIIAKDWKTAFDYFSNDLNKDASNFLAWEGCLSAITQNYSDIDFSRVEFESYKGLETTIQNCFKYSTNDQLQEVTEKANRVREIIIRKNSIETKEKFQSTMQVWRNLFRYGLSLPSLFIFLVGIFAHIPQLVFVSASFFLISTFFQALPGKSEAFRNVKYEDYIDKLDKIIANQQISNVKTGE